MAVGRAGHDYSQISVKGIIGSFYKTLEDELAGMWSNRLGVLIPSNQETETYRWLGHAPQLREWLGGRQERGMAVRSYSLANKTFEATVAVDREDFRFDKTGQLNIRVAELAQRAANHWNQLVTDAITTNGTCWDAQAFFAATHTMGGENSTTYSNLLTSSDYAALNVSTAAAPTSDEFKDILIKLVEHFYSFKDNYSEPYNDGARQFAIMVPQNMAGVAYHAIRADLLGPGANGGGNTNIMRTQDFSVEVIVNTRLAAAGTVVYMFRLDSAMKPFILQEAVPTQIEFLGEGSDTAFKENKFLFGAKAVRNVGYGEWAHAIKATLS